MRLVLQELGLSTRGISQTSGASGFLSTCHWEADRFSAPFHSENTLIGATNDETEKVNSAVDYLEGEPEGTIPEMAKRWKARGQPWMIVTDVRPPLPPLRDLNLTLVGVSTIMEKAAPENTRPSSPVS